MDQDQELLEKPAEIFSPLTLFTCTYVAKLAGLKADFIPLGKLISENLRGPIIAVNSNYIHACQPGAEMYLKTTKKTKKASTGKVRKIQGDGTCFNSAIEPILRIERAGIPASKIYKIRCFPSSGESQVSGTILPDFSDGSQALAEFATYLNSLNISAQPITVINECTNMLNYKFNINLKNPRMIIRIHSLIAVVNEMQELPFPISSLDKHPEGGQLSFNFVCGARRPKIKIFQSGKINFLGVDSTQNAVLIYNFICRMFEEKWAQIITLTPLPDTAQGESAAPSAGRVCGAVRRASLRRRPQGLEHVIVDAVDRKTVAND